MAYLGSWNIDDYLTIPLQCSRFSTGAAYDATGSPAYRIYEDETAMPIVSGGTFTLLDDANTTGFYTDRLQLTTATGFEAGKCYTVWCSATVDSVAAACVHTFQIRAATDAGNTLGTAGAGLTAVPWNSSWDTEVQSECDDALKALGLDHVVSASVAGADVADNSIVAKLVSKESTADWDDFDNTTDSLQAIRDDAATEAEMADAVCDELLSGHTTAGSLARAVSDILDDTGTSGVASVTGAVGSVTGNVGGNVAGSVASVTGAVGSVTGAVGSVTGNVGGNVVGSVGSVTGAVGSVTGNVGGNVTGTIGELAAQAKADVNAQVDAALDTAIAAVTTDPGTTPTPNQILRLVYQALRNKITATDSELALYNDAGNAEAFTKALSDDDTTFTSGTLTDA